MNNAGVLQIFIINGISGKIVYKFSEKNVSLNESIDMLLADNYFILAFKRASSAKGGLPRQELSVTEFYESHEEKDTITLLKDKFINKADRLNKKTFASVEMETPFVVQESYVLTVDVKKIGLTTS